MKTYKIEFKNVTLAYQNEVVLSDLNITFESGKTYGIYGLSGVGKSTLIKAILEPKLIAKGQILINDQDISKIDQKTYKTIKKDISFLFQEPSLIETDDVIENIKRKSNNIYKNWFYKVFRVLTKEQKNELAKILEYLDIFDYINTPVKDLSGGQKQRVELASIFFENKNIILADEPTSNLDFINTKKILEYLQKYVHDNNALLLCNIHDVANSLEYMDYVLLLKNKKLVFIKQANSISEKELQEQY